MARLLKMCRVTAIITLQSMAEKRETFRSTVIDATIKCLSCCEFVIFPCQSKDTFSIVPVEEAR
jgi:hypothetical protein